MSFVREKQTRNVLELIKKDLMNFDAFRLRIKKEKTFVLK
jgi:hypothetical protein